MAETKIKCTISIGPFISGKDYSSDSRLFTNQEDSEDNQVIVIESTEGELQNCYLLPLKQVVTHFIIIK